MASERTMTWFRAAELKHGRVAMLATAGWIVNGLHLSLPGDLSYGLKFSELAALPPLEAWEKVPLGGKLQMLAYIACVEAKSEMGKPHYLKGGDFVKYDLFGLADKMSPEKLLKKQNSELKNGRLAMIGIMSFFAAGTLPGSVPLIH
ncbi:chlorophyll a/b-binding protein domain-containing protein [Pelagophyceae sp. CCMP2097]|nr:chlorophyll a/b-binding protein domain-containing protein [Pelagophyceae sp. CCMP2097]